jgi:hypothetical protein
VEDAVVHEQKAQLRPSQVESIENFGHDEPFCHHDNVSHRNQVGMEAHAAGVHGKNESHNGKIPNLLQKIMISQALRNLEAERSHEVPYHGENEKPVIPPELLSFEMSAHHTQDSRRQGKHRHGYDDFDSPWSDVVGVIAWQARKLGVLWRGHFGTGNEGSIEAVGNRIDVVSLLSEIR